MSTPQPLLDVREINTYYGGIHALKGVSLRVWPGEIVTLIGANGAGKTTTLNTISGLLHPRSGSILLDGEDISHLPAHKIAALGIFQSPEGRRIFGRLSVRENLELGAYARGDKSTLKPQMEKVLALFPRLKERLDQPGGLLSGGEQQMLSIGRALMAQPRIVLLDEPSMGLAPILCELIFEIIHNLNQQGTTILLVEQNAQAALAIASRAYVLQGGKVVLEGPAKDVRSNPDIKRAYLGEGG
jgi:branched-chain amino acid transport system ATP-binding protein